jgi:hypothetical protein
MLRIAPPTSLHVWRARQCGRSVCKLTTDPVSACLLAGPRAQIRLCTAPATISLSLPAFATASLYNLSSRHNQHQARKLEALTDGLMCEALPGVFCAGEMLDWEAPTGGYLLTACLASGHRAGQGVLGWLRA